MIHNSEKNVIRLSIGKKDNTFLQIVTFKKNCHTIFIITKISHYFLIIMTEKQNNNNINLFNTYTYYFCNTIK